MLVSAVVAEADVINVLVSVNKASEVASGSYFLVADGHVSTPIAGTKLAAKETIVDENTVTEGVYYTLTIEETEGGFHIVDVNNNYIYNTMMTPHKLTFGTGKPMDAWTITIADDANCTATIECNEAVLVYVDGEFVSAPINAIPANAVYPTLYGTQPTGIKNAFTNGEAIESIYDLQGRKLEKVTNGGIYIINGKKVLVK